MWAIWEEIRQSRAMMGALFLALLMVSLSGALLIFTSPQWALPPYAVPEAKILASEVRAGERLRIAFRIVRRRICQVDLDRFIVNEVSNETVFRERVPGGVSPLGDDWTVIDIALPDIPPGKYAYVTTITNTCNDGVHSTQTPLVSFTVVPGK